MPQEIIEVDINQPVENPHDFTKPVTLETETVIDFNIPAINKAVIDGDDSSEDDKRRLIKLHLASLLNKDPETMNYDSAVQSYFKMGAAEGSSVNQVFTRLKGAIKPEIDADYTSLVEFDAMSKDEQIKKAFTVRQSESGRIGMDRLFLTAEEHIERQAADVEGHEKELEAIPAEMRAKLINSYKMDLLGKSRRAIIEHGEKLLSPRARHMADSMALDKDMSLTDFNQLSTTDKGFLFQYTRAINPAVDTSTWDYFKTRAGQTGEDIAEGLIKTGQRIKSEPDSPTSTYEKFITNIDKAAVDHFADTGKWKTKEDEQKSVSD